MTSLRLRVSLEVRAPSGTRAVPTSMVEEVPSAIFEISPEWIDFERKLIFKEYLGCRIPEVERRFEELGIAQGTIAALNEPSVKAIASALNRQTTHRVLPENILKRLLSKVPSEQFKDFFDELALSRTTGDSLGIVITQILRYLPDTSRSLAERVLAGARLSSEAIAKIITPPVISSTPNSRE